jgi:hypothetical protein
MHHKDEQKRAQKYSSFVSIDMIFKTNVFSINDDRAKESETLISLLDLGHYHLLLWLRLLKKIACFFFWSLGDHDVANTTLKLNHLKFKRFKLAPSWLQVLTTLLVVVILILVVLILHLLLL